MLIAKIFCVVPLMSGHTAPFGFWLDFREGM